MDLTFFQDFPAVAFNIFKLTTKKVILESGNLELHFKFDHDVIFNMSTSAKYLVLLDYS